MTFKSEWDKSSKFVLNVSEKVVRGTAITVFSSIVKASPVGNPSIWKNPKSAKPGYTGGRFRGNWQTTLAQPAQGTVKGTENQGEVISSIVAKTRPYKIGQTLFMTNNLPYAYRLSRGHSRQRPSGWIESIIAGFQKTVDKEAKKQ